MAMTIQYALMAGRAYLTTRDVINQFSIPEGWAEFFHVPDPAASAMFTATSGFEAVSFKRTTATGTEIVISFAGTYPGDLTGDWAANVGLATGKGSVQLEQAARYFLDVKRQNPSATITLTGHSLGGGLAALVGVFFGVSATTFDQAPFANSAQSNSLLSNPLNIFTPDVAAALKSSLLAAGYTEAEISPLTNFLLIRPTDGSIPNSNLINTIRVDGEFTSALGVGSFDPIGNPATVITHGPHIEPSIDLHDQALLTDFLMSDATASSVAGQKQSLSEVTKKLTSLLGMLFDSNLYSRTTDNTNTTKEDFLNRLLRHEAGMQGIFAADAMVTRFTADLWKLAQDGGLTLNDQNGQPYTYSNWNNVSKALTAFAMQFYYEDTANAVDKNKQLFTDLSASGAGSNGIRFDMHDVSKDVASAMDANAQVDLSKAKGYQYFLAYLDTTALLSSDERTLIKSMLPTLRDWYVQAGANGMVADASTGSAQANRGAFITKNNERSDYDFLEKTLAVLRGGNDWMRWRSCTVNDSAWRAAA